MIILFLSVVVVVCLFLVCRGFCVVNYALVLVCGISGLTLWLLGGVKVIQVFLLSDWNWF